jgi:pyrimidine operon attenuation protein / uracil phosphoribosyltransferase
VAGKNQILTGEVAFKKMQRIALEIAENMVGANEPLIIIGITGSGMVVATKLYNLLQSLIQTELFLVKCTLNKRNPTDIAYSEDIDFNDKHILLVDDVTNSGRTLLYALKPLLDYYPKSIQTMSLVERMHKQYPIEINYIGLSIATTLQNHIEVEVADGEVTGAYIE